MRVFEFDLHKAILLGKDDQVLDHLYKNVLPKVRNYVTNNKGNNHEADDIFQDAVISLYKKIKTNELLEVENVEGYLYLICKNLWINRINKLNKNTQIDALNEFEETSFDALFSIIEDEKRYAFEQLFEKVGERCKELLINVIYNQMSMDEIAEKLNFVNANAAKAHHYRCKQKLVELIENDSILKSILR
jgi:RNA polymerase sigma factor (sigma-70 family)